MAPLTPEQRLQEDYPWTQTPLIASGPMRLIALADMAVEVSRAGGMGFIAGGNDLSTLARDLSRAQTLLSTSPLRTPTSVLPLGIGFLNWGADLPQAVAIMKTFRPAAAWFFAPYSTADLGEWTRRTREATAGTTKIWIQVGTVTNALAVTRECEPDVLVVQGQDAGGHGLNAGASIVPLLPEVMDALAAQYPDASKSGGSNYTGPVVLAAGGIMDGRGLAAALSLGASGAVLGTRYLAAPEAVMAKGYRDEVFRASDGGVTTVRTSVYDTLRGTTQWPKEYGGRGVINRSYRDAEAGMDVAENKALYEKTMKEAGDAGWGVEGRMTTYAGTGVGLVREMKGAAEITKEVREGAKAVMQRALGKL